MSRLVAGKHPSMYTGQVWEAGWADGCEIFLVLGPDDDLPDREAKLLNLTTGELDNVNIIAFSDDPAALAWRRLT